MPREDLYNRAGFEKLYLYMSQLPNCLVQESFMSSLFLGCSNFFGLQEKLLDRMIWVTLSPLSIAECDIKTCVINKTACDLGFQPVVAISEDGCCPIFSCGKYHVSLRNFIYSFNYFSFSE